MSTSQAQGLMQEALKAVDRGSLQLVKLLVRYGADVYATGSGFINVSRTGFRLQHYANLTPPQLAERYERLFPGLRADIVTFLGGMGYRGVDSAMNRYAGALQRAGQDAEARRVADQAERFRGASDAEGSRYLGFDPAVILRVRWRISTAC